MLVLSKTDWVPKAYQVEPTWMIDGSGKSELIYGIVSSRTT